MNELKISCPTIDMRSINKLAEGEELGDAFVAELIFVFLNDLSERVRAISLQFTPSWAANSLSDKVFS